MTMMLTVPKCGERVVDFAAYLRRMQPPVEMNGTGEYLQTLATNYANQGYAFSQSDQFRSPR